jgi:hypothetical protein
VLHRSVNRLRIYPPNRVGKNGPMMDQHRQHDERA